MMTPLTKWFRRGPSCEEVLEVLQAYLDGEVDADRAREVAAHLDRCPPCEHESNLFVQIKTSLKRQRVDVDPHVLTALANFGDRVSRGEIT